VRTLSGRDITGGQSEIRIQKNSISCCVGSEKHARTRSIDRRICGTVAIVIPGDRDIGVLSEEKLQNQL